MPARASLNPSTSRVENVNVFLKDLCSKKNLSIAFISLGLVATAFGGIALSGYGASFIANAFAYSSLTVLVTGVSSSASGFLLLYFSKNKNEKTRSGPKEEIPHSSKSGAISPKTDQQAISIDKVLEACTRGDLQFVEKYIQSGGDVNVRDCFGYSPLHNAILPHKVESLNIVIMLLAAGADPNAKEEVSGRTPLHKAIQEGNNDVIEELLKSDKLEINVQDYDGNTALHHAANKSDPELISILLLKNPDPTIKNKEGDIAAQIAFKLYVKETGNSDKRLSYIRINYYNGTNKDVFFRACEAGIKRNVERYLKANCSVKIFNEEGLTPLHVSTVDGKSVKITTLLLNAGADVNAMSDEKKGCPLTPLMYACCCQNTKAVDILLRSKNLQIDVCNKDGNTALHFAAKLGCEIIVRKLVAAGARYDIKNKDKKTAKQLAIDEGHANLASFMDS